jgi:hypothetical protein
MFNYNLIKFKPGDIIHFNECIGQILKVPRGVPNPEYKIKWIAGHFVGQTLFHSGPHVDQCFELMGFEERAKLL